MNPMGTNDIDIGPKFPFFKVGTADMGIMAEIQSKRLGLESKKEEIIRRANELGEDPIHLSGRFCDEFHDHMASLQCLPPTSEPRVSDHMSQIIDMITQTGKREETGEFLTNRFV
ncbi:hypothetical protein AAC387_Pa03g1293 [Persea americana]